MDEDLRKDLRLRVDIFLKLAGCCVSEVNIQREGYGNTYIRNEKSVTIIGSKTTVIVKIVSITLDYEPLLKRTVQFFILLGTHLWPISA